LIGIVDVDDHKDRVAVRRGLGAVIRRAIHLHRAGNQAALERLIEAADRRRIEELEEAHLKGWRLCSGQETPEG